MTHKTLFNPFPGKNNFSFPQSLVSVCKVVFSVCHNKRPPMIHYIIEDLYILHNSLSQQFLFFTEDCFYCCACRAVTIFCSCCVSVILSIKLKNRLCKPCLAFFLQNFECPRHFHNAPLLNLYHCLYIWIIKFFRQILSDFDP